MRPTHPKPRPIAPHGPRLTIRRSARSGLKRSPGPFPNRPSPPVVPEARLQRDAGAFAQSQGSARSALKTSTGCFPRRASPPQVRRGPQLCLTRARLPRPQNLQAPPKPLTGKANSTYPQKFHRNINTLSPEKFHRPAFFACGTQFHLRVFPYRDGFSESERCAKAPRSWSEMRRIFGTGSDREGFWETVRS